MRRNFSIGSSSHRASHGNRRDPVRGAAAGHAADGGRHEFGNAVGARDRIGAADAGLSHLDDRELSGTVYEGFAVERHEILGEGVGRLLNARMKAHRTKMQIHEILLAYESKTSRRAKLCLVRRSIGGGKRGGRKMRERIRKKFPAGTFRKMERVKGVEPSSLAWKARVIAVIRHPHPRS